MKKHYPNNLTEIPSRPYGDGISGGLGERTGLENCKIEKGCRKYATASYYIFMFVGVTIAS
jgi:hypothetical protein